MSRTRYFTCCRAMESQSSTSARLRHLCRDTMPVLVVGQAPWTAARADFLSLLLTSIAVTLPDPASHEQSSAAAVSTPICFSPTLLPCSFSFAPVSLPLRTCNALALIVTPLSSPSFPLYSPSSFSLLIVVWVFRTPCRSAPILGLTGVDLRQRSPCQHVFSFS